MRPLAPTRPTIAPLRRVAPLLLLGAFAAGCLGEPKIEERWTRLDLISSSLAPYQPATPSAIDSIYGRIAITYRAIRTGFVVVELRASGRIQGSDVVLAPDAPREPMAAQIDSVLARSVSLGRMTRAITGWDHLIQRMDYGFKAWLPARLDTSAVPPGSTPNLFLVAYLAQGDEVERQDGSDTLIVTPLPSGPYEILPVGLELTAPPVPGSQR